MDFTFETQGTNTYLVYKVSESDRIDSMSLGMLTNNKIPGLASTLFTQVDMTKYIKFNVSARVSVKQFFSGPVNRKRLIGVFNGIVNAMLNSEEYMIDPNSIILNLDYIFADVSTCDTVLICMPIEGYSNGVKLGEFFKNIMFNTQFDQTENCDHVAKIMNYLNSTPNLALEDFKNILVSLNTNAAPEARKNENTTHIDKGGDSQPKVNGEFTVKQQNGVNSVGSEKKQSIDSKNAAVTSLPDGSPKLSGIPVTHPTEAGKSLSQKEKKPGFFERFRKKDASKSKVQSSKKSVNQIANTAYAVPGVPDSISAISDKPNSVAPKQKSMGQNVVHNGTSEHTNIPAETGNPNIQPLITPLGHAANFGETTVLNNSNIGETTVLRAAQQQVQQITPFLVRNKNNEKIYINKPVFRIGKERSYVDYFIGDNTAISRSHANIICRDEEYFIVDTNSTNHSFVNGEMIPTNVEVQIDHGSKIMLANEEFEFRLY